MEHSATRIIKYVYFLTLTIGIIVWVFNKPEYITKNFSRVCGENAILLYYNGEVPTGSVNTHNVSLDNASTLTTNTSEVNALSGSCYIALTDFLNKEWPIFGNQIRKWQLSIMYFFMILTAICLGAYLYFRNSEKS